MPRPLLSSSALAVLLLGLGAAAEAQAPLSSPLLTAADFAVGAEFVLGGAYLLSRVPRLALLALAVAATWFLGTLVGARSGALSETGVLFLLAYRGALLQLLLSAASGVLGRSELRLIAIVGWAVAFLPVSAGRPATTAAAALVALTIAHRASRSLRIERGAILARAGSAIVLSAVWALAMVNAVSASALLTLDDLAVAGAGVVALFIPRLWKRTTAVLVVELGSSAHAGQPIVDRLARVLLDPGLEVHYNVPGVGWVDEQGHPSIPLEADGRAITRASAPAGGEVALVHGPGAAPDARLAGAAAAAAALVLDTARLEAELRGRAEDVRASRRRLLGTADAERRSLEGRLSREVLAKLRSVDDILGQQGGILGEQGGIVDQQGGAAEVLSELRDAMAEVAALGRGLYPPDLVRLDLGSALKELAKRSPVPATLDVQGGIDAVSEPTRTAAWFVCGEALANIARHAQASHVAISAAAGDGLFVVQVVDNGRGGATMGSGLRGLADRVEALGGQFTLSSPVGGPTVVRAALPP